MVRMEYFAEGKRSLIYKTVTDKKILLTKKEKPASKAINRTKNEVQWLERLNEKGIGPKLVSHTENSFTYEFVPGQPIIPWTRQQDKRSIVRMLQNVLQQCRTLDKMHVIKEEMHHPVKHIIIEKKPVMIDFERCHYSGNPKNVTQFFQFLTGRRMRAILEEKGMRFKTEKLRELLQEYKMRQTDAIFKKLLKVIR